MNLVFLSLEAAGLLRWQSMLAGGKVAPNPKGREEKLTRQGYFSNHKEVIMYSENLESIFNDPNQKNLRWQYAVDEDILSDEVR